jgi:cholest-4-en-3-one 26-monooxygenase
VTNTVDANDLDAKDLVLHDPATYTHGFPYEAFVSCAPMTRCRTTSTRTGRRGYWAVVRHDDVQAPLTDPASFRNAPRIPSSETDDGWPRGQRGLLISIDAPAHFKMRKLINRRFTPNVGDLTDRIRRASTRSSTTPRRGDPATWSTTSRCWLPLHVIADLVGVPEEDRRRVFEWTETTFGFDASVTPSSDRRR